MCPAPRSAKRNSWVTPQLECDQLGLESGADIQMYCRMSIWGAASVADSVIDNTSQEHNTDSMFLKKVFTCAVCRSTQKHEAHALSTS